MINAIARYKDDNSLSSQEKNALEAIAKLVVITDEGMLDINNYNKSAKDTKDKDDYACKVLRKLSKEFQAYIRGFKIEKVILLIVDTQLDIEVLCS